VVKGGHAIAPAISTYIMGCDDLPKGSQQPVIDDFEKPGHDDSYGAVEYTGGGGLSGYGSGFFAWVFAVQSLLSGKTLVDFVAGEKEGQGGRRGTLPGWS